MTRTDAITHKTVMVELGTPAKLMGERMGHEDGSIQARYSHVTPDMRQRLVTGLTGLWEAALTARRDMAPAKPPLHLGNLGNSAHPPL